MRVERGRLWLRGIRWVKKGGKCKVVDLFVEFGKKSVWFILLVEFCQFVYVYFTCIYIHYSFACCVTGHDCPITACSNTSICSRTTSINLTNFALDTILKFIFHILHVHIFRVTVTLISWTWIFMRSRVRQAIYFLSSSRFYRRNRVIFSSQFFLPPFCESRMHS